MRGASQTLAAVGAVMLLGVGAPDAVATYPGANGLIAYSDRAGIHLVRADGSEDRLLYPDGWDVSWAPSGARLAFADRRGITQIREDGTGLRQIIGYRDRRVRRALSVRRFDGLAVGRPAWTPDGRRVSFTAFVCRPGYACDYGEGLGEPTLFTISPRGTRMRRLRPGSNATWAATGRRIGFVTPDGSLAVMTPGGRHVTPILDCRHGTTLDFAPTASKLVAVCGSSLRVVDTDARRVVLSTSVGGAVAAWTPDGERIAYTSSRLEDPALHWVRPNGADSERLFDFPSATTASSLSWQPLP